MDLIRMSFYIVFGAVPASFLMLLSSGLILSDRTLDQALGLASIVGVIGLWLATFYKASKTKLSFCISLCLMAGFVALAYIATDILAREFLSLAEFLFITPLIVAGHYLVLYAILFLRKQHNET